MSSSTDTDASASGGSTSAAGDADGQTAGKAIGRVVVTTASGRHDAYRKAVHRYYTWSARTGR